MHAFTPGCSPKNWHNKCVWHGLLPYTDLELSNLPGHVVNPAVSSPCMYSCFLSLWSVVSYTYVVFNRNMIYWLLWWIYYIFALIMPSDHYSLYSTFVLYRSPDNKRVYMASTYKTYSTQNVSLKYIFQFESKEYPADHGNKCWQSRFEPK